MSPFVVGIAFFISLSFFFFIEGFIKNSWNEIYFTSGIPIFIKRIPVPKPSMKPPKFHFALQYQSTISNSFRFKEIKSNTFGFQETKFQLIRYPRLMHGMLFFDDDKYQVVVKGFLNYSIAWLYILFFCMALFFSTGPDIALELLLIISIIGLTYLFERSKYIEIANFASEIWSRDLKANRLA